MILRQAQDDGFGFAEAWRGQLEVEGIAPSMPHGLAGADQGSDGVLPSNVLTRARRVVYPTLRVADAALRAVNPRVPSATPALPFGDAGPASDDPREPVSPPALRFATPALHFVTPG